MRFLMTIGVLVAGCSQHHSGALNAPSNLTVTEQSGGAHLTWKDNSDDETEFMIERKAAGGSFATLGTVPFNTTAYHDGAVQGGTVYSYRVSAMKGTEHSAPTAEVEFTAPTNLSTDMAMKGSATCHSAGCRAFSSYCSTNACTCVGVIQDNADPPCTGMMVTCTVDPCQGKTATCNHGTGLCDVN